MPTKKRKRAPTVQSAHIILLTSAFLVIGALGLAFSLTRLQSSRIHTPLTGSGPDESGSDASSLVDPVSQEHVPPVEYAQDPIIDTEPAATTARPVPDARRIKKTRGILVFVIDDAGHNEWQLKPFLELPGPVTIAVLPGLPFTTSSAESVRNAGKELLLHQPMEALAGLDPGPGAIRADMDDATIRRVLRNNLAQVPGAAGVNNHMGSRATSDIRVMSTVLDELSTAGVYFLDSLTISDSVVHSVASLMRQSIWERSVFLDNTPDRASMLHYIAEGTKIAEKRGYAIMIGHVWSAELAQTLADLYPQLMEQGFSLSTISRIMMDSDDDDDIGD